jgi:hypothetical protein
VNPLRIHVISADGKVPPATELIDAVASSTVAAPIDAHGGA